MPLLTLVVLLGLGANKARAADTLLRYEQRIARAAEVVDRIKQVANPSDAEELTQDVETLVPKSEQVEFDGQTAMVDNSWLYSLLDSRQRKRGAGSTERLDEARTRLLALREQLLRVENEKEGGTDPETRHDRLNRILARPEFTQKKEDRLAKFVARVREAIYTFAQRLFTKLFRLIFGERGEAGWIFRGFVILVIALFVAVAVMMIVRWRPSRKKARPRKRIVLDEEIGPDVTSKDLLGEALEAYKKGDFRLGIRRLYIALLYELGERDIITLDRHATNNEYLKKAAAVGPLQAPMRYLTERFDYFWYGRFPADSSDFSAFKASFDQATRVAASYSGQKNGQQRATR
ncbi:MAG TPA: DUF4129 domain-containing protein [Blastocatellia bacterium]